MLSELIKKLRGKKPKYLYRSGWNSDDGGNQPRYMIEEMVINNGPSYPKQKEDTRIIAKPVDVYKEIISEEPHMNLKDLDKQLKAVQRRKDMLEELGIEAGMEYEAVEFLKARKLWTVNKDKFRWNIASFDGVKDLCKKYKLREVGFESFYRNVPMEAVDELEKFNNAYKKIRKDRPMLKLIIDDGGKETRKDPILLASSPFGRWWYILGAWDKEVEYVDDLIYRGK